MKIRIKLLLITRYIAITNELLMNLHMNNKRLEKLYCQKF